MPWGLLQVVERELGFQSSTLTSLKLRAALGIITPKHFCLSTYWTKGIQQSEGSLLKRIARIGSQKQKNNKAREGDT